MSSSSRHILLFVFVVIFFKSIRSEHEPYFIPKPSIEVFRPHGLRVSIPDYPNIRLFAIHAVINRELNGLEAGDISKDILKKTDGRWVFEDNKIKLNYGDIINYWLFVIKGNLGYRLDDQTYVVKNFQDLPSHFEPTSATIDNRRTTTSTTPSVPLVLQYVPGSYVPPQITCVCPAPAAPSTQPCPEPASSTSRYTTTPRTPTTPETPTTSTATTPETTPADLTIWRELLVNLSKENAEFREKMIVLKENNELLIAKLEKLGDENLNKLILSGPIPPKDAPKVLVKTILSEKLGIRDINIVKSAVKINNETIVFELNNIDNKLLILRAVKGKLTNSKFTIKDIDAVSFMNAETGQPIFDSRNL